MKRRTFGSALGAAVAGILAGSKADIVLGLESPSPAPRHVCKGLNQCKGQGACKHGCSGHGCKGQNDCKGKGGCAALAAQHSCAGKNTCKAIGGCASGDQGCAGKNSCKGRGGCEVPLRIDHYVARQQATGKKSP